MSAVLLNPPFLGSGVIERSSFDRVLLKEWDLRRRRIVDCSFRDCEITGAFADVEFVRTRFERCVFRDVSFVKVSFLDSQLDEARLLESTWLKGRVTATKISGELVDSNWRELWFEQADLSGLAVRGSYLGRTSGTARLPQNADGFFVPLSAFRAVRDVVAGSLSSRARAAYDSVVMEYAADPPHDGDLISIYPGFFREMTSHGGSLSEIEATQIARALFDYKRSTTSA